MILSKIFLVIYKFCFWSRVCITLTLTRKLLKHMFEKTELFSISKDQPLSKALLVRRKTPRPFDHDTFPRVAWKYDPKEDAHNLTKRKKQVWETTFSKINTQTKQNKTKQTNWYLISCAAPQSPHETTKIQKLKPILLPRAKGGRNRKAILNIWSDMKRYHTASTFDDCDSKAEPVRFRLTADQDQANATKQKQNQIINCDNNQHKWFTKKKNNNNNNTTKITLSLL